MNSFFYSNFLSFFLNSTGLSGITSQIVIYYSSVSKYNIGRFDFLDSYMNLKKSKRFIFWNGRSTKQGRGFIQTIFFE